MAVAHAAGGSRIVVIQPGVSAILTVADAGGEAGVHRLIDALIGGGVALFFSQVLFSPERWLCSGVPRRMRSSELPAGSRGRPVRWIEIGTRG